MFKNVALQENLLRRATLFCLCWMFLTNVQASDTYKNPIIGDGADPWVIQKDGFYYYTQTTGNDVRIRKAAQITGTNGLGSALAVKVFTPLLPNNKNVWAPELHFLNGKWYIYYAADDGVNANHRMYVAESITSDPQGLYTFKGKIYDSTDRWAIDGTVLQMDNGSLYFLWSGWPGSVDGKQNIYIASMSNPWTIDGPRVLLSTPTHAWEGWIHEGPQVIKRNGKIFIVYSANASWTDNYCLGILTNTDGNVLNTNSWTKSSTPIFKSYSDLNGSVYGPGHGSFTQSVDGAEDLIIYHAAKSSGSGWSRNVRVQRFSWNPDDSPNFDVPIPTSIPLTVPSGEKPAPTPVTTYTLAVNASHGAVRASPEQLSYKPGSVVTLTAYDYQGFRFTGWTGDVWTTNQSITVTMDRHKTATANFTRPLVLIDNPNASFTGTWTLSTNSTERFGPDYHYARTSNSVTHSARFTPNISTAGKYDVYTLYSSGSNRSAFAPWLVSAQGGTNTVYINQKENGGSFRTLATERNFAQGTSGFVQLSNNTGETNSVVIADVVAFLYSTNQDAAPFIFSQPLSQTVAVGSNVTLQVRALGTPGYQWIFQDQILEGATTSMLTIANFNSQNEGQYRVVVSNALGVVTSSNAVLRAGSPLRLSSLFWHPSGLSEFQMIGAVGSNYVLEASENLQDWVQLETNLSINGFWDITIGNATNVSQRFYRATSH
ncbi:MAG: family 43 glycosylhydrolase [Verrucomicrobia bacterium]|nr:family 43 glycosylhydrolase [Verrucomicrobiota bacterium]